MSATAIEPSCALYYASEPQVSTPGQKTWITRSASRVVVISQVSAGRNADEYPMPAAASV